MKSQKESLQLIKTGVYYEKAVSRSRACRQSLCDYSFSLEAVCPLDMSDIRKSHRRMSAPEDKTMTAIDRRGADGNCDK